MNKTISSYPLARRLTDIIILSSLGFAVILIAIQVMINFQKELTGLEDRLEKIHISETPQLSNSIWHFDETQIQLQMQGMLNIQDISYVEVEVYGGETYKLGNPVNDNQAKVEVIPLQYSHDGRIYDVGKLTVIADLSRVWVRIESWIVSIIIMSIIQTLLLAGIILYVIDRILTKPLSEIAQYAESLDLDNLNRPLVLKSRRFSSPGDELELVAVKLNDMRLRLVESIASRKEAEDALDQSEQNYQKIFNATSDGIIIRNAKDFSITEVNDAVLRMYGYDDKKELIGTQLQDLSTSETDYSEQSAKNIINLAITRGPQMFEWHAKKKDGESFWIEVSIRNSSIGGRDHIISTIRDISERKRAEEILVAQNEALVLQSIALEEAQSKMISLNEALEERVQQRTIQLQALNQELEAFSYSVAHDLRAPLRHISGFSQVILDSYGNSLNEEIVGWLKRIQDSSQNLFNMVEALLGLSRVTRDSIHITKINLSNLVEKITDQIKKENPERSISIQIEQEVFINADLRLLQIMMENMLLNALKFTANEALAEIEFATFDSPQKDSSRKDYTCFYIRDNGVGFDMSYVDRLFGPFQRLHSVNEFSGTGIGLATVKRIVQRHGGSVWAKAAVNQGATFYFCFPDTQKGTSLDM
jgi:PAS domain S-box-containing protein